jgi:gliding motility-associated-like protein
LDIPITPSFPAACPGEVIQFSFDTTGLTNVQVSIIDGNGSLSCDDCPNPVLTYEGGTVTIQVTADENVETACGAVGATSVTMKIDQQQVFSVDLCRGIPEMIDLPANVGPSSMIMVTPGTVISCINCLNPTITITENETLTVISESQNPNFCFLETTINLNLIIDSSDVDFVVEPAMPGQGESATVTIFTTPMDPAGTVYSWTVNGAAVSGSTSAITAPMPEEQNLVMVEWINAFGCLQRAMIIVETRPPDYKIPKAFSPEREFNKLFRVDITGLITVEEMLVFNRWGQLVFEGRNLTGQEGWDGRRDGEPAPPEVYAYLIKLQFPDGRLVVEKGDVTLIR